MKRASPKSLIYSLGFFARILAGTRLLFCCRKASFTVLVMQLYFTFVQALFLIALLGAGIGTAIIAVATPFLAAISKQSLIYPLLITIITRELGPLLVAFIVIARSATAIATEIAGMVISNEVEAYISVGVDPIEHLAVPRFLGVTISLFLLNMYFSIFGLGVSALLAHSFIPQFTFSSFSAGLMLALTPGDLLISIVKSLAFGMIISTLALTRGFSVERASTEVPVAGLKAVTSSFAWCIVVNVLLTVLYYKALV